MTSRTSLRSPAVLLCALVAVAATTTACTSNGPDSPHTLPNGTLDRGIDARSYYDDYAEAADEDMAYSAGSASQARPGGVAGPGAVEDAPGWPGPLDDNMFVDAGTSGFVDAVADPLSTFGLDVDTGSYSVAKTLLDQDLLPPPESIRVEEWVDSFDYGDANTTESDLALTTEAGMSPSLGDGTQLVRLGVSARDLDAQDRPPVALTLVVDRSGSMDIRERLGLVQSSLALLANSLRNDDTIALVSYDDNARPILEPTPVSETETILDAIDELRPGGSTNLAAGLRLGYDQARDSFRHDGLNVVVLCSDGVANVGRTGPHSITQMIADQGREGIHLVTVGYGMGNYNDHLMEQLADQGDGFYAYVDSFDEAERLFVADLTTTLTPVAGDAKTQVAFDPELVTSYRLIGYDNRALDDDDFTDKSVDAGELGAGHQVSALYEVRLAPGVEPGTPIGEASVRWTSVETGRALQQQVDLVAADPEATPSDSLVLAGTVAEFAQLLKGDQPFAGRDVSYDDLVERVRPLVAADVAGSGELSRLIGSAGDLD